MSEDWANRQRRTNKLTRLMAQYVFSGQSVTAKQLHGLCQLTWITVASESVDHPYSTTYAALGKIVGADYSDATAEEVAQDVVQKIDEPRARQLILQPTGFTNFYRAYRNSSLPWIAKHIGRIQPVLEKASKFRSDDDARSAIDQITKLPGIPKTNHHDQQMHPHYLLTPALFALDPRLRFPLINGATGVRRLLKKIGADRATPPEQFDAMVGLYGKGGIRDAADLDQIGADLPDFTETTSKAATKQLLTSQDTEGNDLALKDEDDIEMIKKAGTIVCRRIHNQLTNKLKSCRSNYTLFEGADRKAMFDVIVKRFRDDQADLLIEVKSSTDIGQVRMAIGQLYHYGYTIYGDEKHYLAIMLPDPPETDVKNLLKWLDIGVLWFNGEELETSTSWLKPFTQNSP